MQRPAAIRWTIYIIIADAVINLPFAWIGISHAPERVSKPLMIGLMIAFHGTMFALAYFIAQARQWARVLLALGVTLTLWTSRRGPPDTVTQPWAIARFWLVVAFMAAVLALLLLPSTTAWFREQKLSRQRKS